ncbi:MAG: helix-turn-helix transcriptional regulator [Nocardioides sp.]|nr:helix-turn-helix transcriptional regulator [Nocardioides sp.]
MTAPLVCDATTSPTRVADVHQDASAALLTTSLLRHVTALQHLAALPPAAPGERPRLSGRELDVVALIAEGCLNREIAVRLQLSRDTVKSYIRAAYRKMGVTHRAQAVRWWLGDRDGSVRRLQETPPAPTEALS